MVVSPLRLAGPIPLISVFSLFFGQKKSCFLPFRKKNTQVSRLFIQLESDKAHSASKNAFYSLALRAEGESLKNAPDGPVLRRHKEITMPKVPAKQSPSKAVALPSQAFEEYAGQGLENVTSKDLLVPRLTILQALSPQLDKKKAEFIKGASIGDIVDVGTGDLWTEEKLPLLFLPVYYRKDYLEWGPRASGKGLVHIHPDESILQKCKMNEKNKPILPNGNYIAETAQIFGLNLSADGRRCFIAMTSTQLKKARKWTTMATGEKIEREDGTTFVPPLFYRTYHLGTGEESNNEGTWSGWTVDRHVALPELPHWEDLKRIAVEFRDSLVAGIAKADATSFNEGESAASEDGAM
jgi:hypothetical protein